MALLKFKKVGLGGTAGTDSNTVYIKEELTSNGTAYRTTLGGLNLGVQFKLKQLFTAVYTDTTASFGFTPAQEEFNSRMFILKYEAGDVKETLIVKGSDLTDTQGLYKQLVFTTSYSEKYYLTSVRVFIRITQDGQSSYNANLSFTEREIEGITLPTGGTNRISSAKVTLYEIL